MNTQQLTELLYEVATATWNRYSHSNPAYRMLDRDDAIQEAVARGWAFASPDGTLAFFDLREYGRTVRARLGPDGMRALRATALADRGNPRVFG